MDEKFKKKVNEYCARFGECFPIYMLAISSDEGYIKMIDDCLEHGKNLEEMGYLDDLDLENSDY